jgi:hypothetical protein
VGAAVVGEESGSGVRNSSASSTKSGDVWDTAWGSLFATLNKLLLKGCAAILLRISGAPETSSDGGPGGWWTAVAAALETSPGVPQAVAGLAAGWVAMCRQSLSRLWVPHSSFHSAWQARMPRRMNLRAPWWSLIWPNTGSTVSRRKA